MNKIKRIVLSLSIALTIIVALIVSMVFKFNDSDSDIPAKAVNSDIKYTNTFEEGEVVIQTGGSNLNYSYTPDINSNAGVSVAYEYIFHNPMNVEQAVNLKSIDSTNVTLSYAYSDSHLTSVTGSNDTFELQKLRANSSKYIYIVVTPTNSEIPTTFQSSVEWYQGKAGTLTTYKENGEVLSTQNIVKGQPVETPTYIPTVPTGEKFQGWFLDEDCILQADLTSIQGDKLYPYVAEVYPTANLPDDWLQYVNDGKYGGPYYRVIKYQATPLPNPLVIPRAVLYQGTYVPVREIAATSELFYSGNVNISSITLPDTLRTIGGNSFRNLTKLTSIKIPEGVITIGGNAFYNTGLKSIHIPSTVNSIGNSICAVSYSRLTKITVDANNKVYDSRDNCNAIIHTSTNKIISGCYGTVIPYGVQSIAAYAFNYVTMNSLIIPASVTTIEYRAFSGATIYTLTVAAEHPYWDSRLNCNAIIDTSEDKLILGSINTVIPDTVKTIGEESFVNAPWLTSITIPASVIRIEINAFLACVNLKSATFEDISYWHRTSDPTYIDGTATSVINTSTNATNLLPPAGTTTSSYWYKLTPNLPDSWIGYDGTNYYVQKGNSSLYTDTIIPGIYTRNGVTAPVTYIKSSAFNGNAGLLTVKTPDTLKTIYAQAFRGCSSLTSVSIGCSVSLIEDNTFANTALTSITVSSENTTYDSRNNCNAIIHTATNRLIAGSLNTVIPNTVVTIGTYAFGYINCNSLTIPASVTTIEYRAFSGARISTLTVASDHPTWDSRDNCNAVIETSTNKLILGAVYTTIPNTVTSIGEESYVNAGWLYSITIPASVTNIEKNAFLACTNLSNATFKDMDDYWTVSNGSTTVYKNVFYTASNAGALNNSYVGYAWNKTTQSSMVAFIGSTGYQTIEDALKAATSTSTIYVYPRLDNLTITITKNCAVPSGASLILLYGSSTSDRNPNGSATHSNASISTVFYQVGRRTLRVYMNAGVILTVNSGATLEVAGQLHSYKGGDKYTGLTAGNYAEITLRANAKINVNSGTIKCTGYIRSNGLNDGSAVNAVNSDIYMPFVICDFRGGSYMFAAKNAGIPIFSQYELVNMAINVNLDYNSSIITYVNATINNSVMSDIVYFAGNTSDYLFQMTNSSYSSISMTFTSGTEINVVNLYGGAKLNHISVTSKILIFDITISSEDFHLPISWMWNIRLLNATGQTGAYYDFRQDIKMLPGSELYVGFGVTVDFADLVIYDTYTDRNGTATNLNYPTNKAGAKFGMNGTMTCDRVLGRIWASSYQTEEGRDYEGEIISITINATISGTGVPEANGEVSGNLMSSSISTIQSTEAASTCEFKLEASLAMDNDNYVEHVYTYDGVKCKYILNECWNLVRTDL